MSKAIVYECHYLHTKSGPTLFSNSIDCKLKTGMQNLTTTESRTMVWYSRSTLSCSSSYDGGSVVCECGIF